MRTSVGAQGRRAQGLRSNHVAPAGSAVTVGKMPSVIKSVSFDAADALALARFCAAGVGPGVVVRPAAPAGWAGPCRGERGGVF